MNKRFGSKSYQQSIGYSHCSQSPSEGTIPEHMAIMSEKEPVHSEAHLLGQRVFNLVINMALRNPVLHLRFLGQPANITVDV